MTAEPAYLATRLTLQLEIRRSAAMVEATRHAVSFDERPLTSASKVIHAVPAPPTAAGHAHGSPGQRQPVSPDGGRVGAAVGLSEDEPGAAEAGPGGPCGGGYVGTPWACAGEYVAPNGRGMAVGSAPAGR